MFQDDYKECNDRIRLDPAAEKGSKRRCGMRKAAEIKEHNFTDTGWRPRRQ